MTPRSRLLLTALVLLTSLTVRPPAAAFAEPRTGCAGSMPYVSGRGGYAVYRIPALVRTRHGTLLAFAEGRRSGPADTGAIDVVLRRSTDGGCTWGPLTVVAAGHGDTRGNPAPVVDPRTGAVVLVTCSHSGRLTEEQIRRGAGERRVFVQRSRDDGRHFTPPVDITASVKRPGWTWYATGPGHAVALTRGPHSPTGSAPVRLLVPADHSGSGSPSDGGHALYSDDGGRTWHLGFVTEPHGGAIRPNETTAAQLPDGRVYFNARDQYGSAPGNRLDTYSSDGGATLDRPYAVQPTLNAVPVVQGSLLQLRGRSAPLLFSAPSAPTARRALAIWSSTDAGRTFTRLLTLSDRPAAYSDLVQLDPRTIGVLYETGSVRPYDTLEFRSLAVPEG
ncbi:sialidase family protein [Streptomyces sp. NBC_00557]|uniref:sialidase family protein n=1 Tax=Streptomyces sp. NBC_00557 TaxID=2975776 RepID=UPI002E7FD890|nr:sialidase family protein [Streptomyces sp. NBC_00557]WUC37062.1 glycoside hydrolase [Streptomyces sp. NBC_00557]